jgi:predicted ArsR family transcriptional regulator
MALLEDLSSLLSPSRARLVDLMKRKGSTTVAEATEQLDLAETTIRQHLERLGQQGLVDHESQSSGRGRPTLRYRLSPLGERLFPTQDGALMRELVDFLVQQGYPSLVDAFFQQMWQERADELQERIEESEAGELEATLEVLREFLAEQGFMPEVDRQGEDVTIRECNCPFPESVRATRLPCRLEAEFLERVLGRELTRVGYMPDGEPACTYEFKADEE